MPTRRPFHPRRRSAPGAGIDLLFKLPVRQANILMVDNDRLIVRIQLYDFIKQAADRLSDQGWLEAPLV